MQHTRLKEKKSWRPRKVGDLVELVRGNNFDTLSEHGKYIVLKNRLVPEANFDFPKTIKHGCNRSCKTAYLSDFFVYSCRGNAVYCLYCMLFVPKYRRNILGAFVNRGYREWHNIMEKEKKHSQNTYHKEVITLALTAIDRFEKPECTVPALIDNSIKESFETCPKVVHAIYQVSHFVATGRSSITRSLVITQAIFYLFLQKLHTIIQYYRSI